MRILKSSTNRASALLGCPTRGRFRNAGLQRCKNDDSFPFAVTTQISTWSTPSQRETLHLFACRPSTSVPNHYCKRSLAAPLLSLRVSLCEIFLRSEHKVITVRGLELPALNTLFTKNRRVRLVPSLWSKISAGSSSDQCLRKIVRETWES